MSTYIATVIRTGNSYALRVPKTYIEQAQLGLGDKASLALPQKHPQQTAADRTRLWQEFQALQPFQSINDPQAWQRDLRQDRTMPTRG